MGTVIYNVVYSWPHSSPAPTTLHLTVALLHDLWPHGFLTVPNKISLLRNVYTYKIHLKASEVGRTLGIYYPLSRAS